MLETIQILIGLPLGYLGRVALPLLLFGRDIALAELLAQNAAHQLILTQKNLKVNSLAELKGKNIAVCANSAGDIISSKAFGKASPNIKRFDNTPLALEELNAGGVDAAVGDVGVFAYYAQQNPDKDFNMTRDTSFEDQYFGIAVRKGNTELLNKINEGLKKVIASGAYEKVYRKWFGSDAPKLPAFTK